MLRQEVTFMVPDGGPIDMLPHQSNFSGVRLGVAAAAALIARRRMTPRSSQRSTV